MRTQTLTVDGMSCGNCEAAIKRGVSEIQGVVEVEASHTDRSVKVAYDDASVDEAVIRQRIDELGFTVVA